MRRHDLLKSGVSIAKSVSIFLNHHSNFSKEKEKGPKSYGRPQIGGPFSLSTHDSKPFTQENLLGKWSLVYFGFTNCPDICPAELDKVTAVLNNIRTRLVPLRRRSLIEYVKQRRSTAIYFYLSSFL
jgi:cytochrome oxidase Cu insertion factor (SCO1/SenC/PrrC family)